MADHGDPRCLAEAPSQTIAATLREQAERMPEGEIRDLALRSATRWDELPDDGSAADLPVELPTNEEVRAITIAYTALWQLREATVDGNGNYNEPTVLFDARVDLRRRLDAHDAASSIVSLTRKERNLIARELYRRIPIEAEALITDSFAGSISSAGAVVARWWQLFHALGGRKSISRKRARQMEQTSWEVEGDVFAGGMLHLRERLEEEEADISRSIDRTKTGAAEEAELRKRLRKLQSVLERTAAIEAKWSHVERVGA